MRIHAVYTRTLELKIELRWVSGAEGRARGAIERTRRVRNGQGEGAVERGERGDTLISERIYKQPPRVPRIVRPSPTSYIYC